MNTSAERRRALLDIARNAIDFGLDHGRAPSLRLEAYPEALRQPQASFVTLELDGRLRGCMGGLSPRLPLVADISEHAYMAAFADPRFKPLSRTESEHIAISLSLLSERKAIRFESEAALIEQLRPYEDGLILERGDHRGTFLPAVWHSLPEPREFLTQLKKKAGLAADACDYQAWRYTAESIA